MWNRIQPYRWASGLSQPTRSRQSRGSLIDKRWPKRSSFPTGWKPMLLCSSSLRDVSACRRWEDRPTRRSSRLNRLFDHTPIRRYADTLFLATPVISFSFKRALTQEFEIPGRQSCRCRRHQYRRSTPHKAAPKGLLWAQHLVITDVSDEIFRQSDKSKLSGSNAELL